MPTDPVIHQEWLSKIITDADNYPSTNIYPVLIRLRMETIVFRQYVYYIQSKPGQRK